MKLDALVTRGSRKDFYDLYAIVQQISIRSLLDLGRTKYPRVRDFGLMAVESAEYPCEHRMSDGNRSHPISLPRSCVVMHTRTLCVPGQIDAERLRMHSDAEHWNEG